MSKRDDYLRSLQTVITSHAEIDTRINALEQFLLSNSNLPGPRGNLELSAAFSDTVGSIGYAQWLEDVIVRWIGMTAEQAPTGETAEYLPFCGTHALGILYSLVGERRQQEIIDMLKIKANDPRWRIREAVAMAFQHLLEKDFIVVKDIFSLWIDHASLAEQRAMLASLAHPPALHQPNDVQFCLDISERILEKFKSIDVKDRKGEECRILKKGLDYSISVFIAKSPQAGFQMLKKWAYTDDKMIQRIITSNLQKKRLLNKYPNQVAEVLELLK